MLVLVVRGPVGFRVARSGTERAPLSTVLGLASRPVIKS